jgi:hypothetical protein
VQSLHPGDETPHCPTHRVDPELYIKLLGHLAEFTRENQPEPTLAILLAWLAAAFARGNRPEPTLNILLPWLVAGFYPENGPDPPLGIHQQPFKAGFQSLDEAQPTVDEVQAAVDEVFAAADEVQTALIEGLQVRRKVSAMPRTAQRTDGEGLGVNKGRSASSPQPQRE